MAPKKGTSASKVAAKAAKKSKQIDKAAKKEALAIEAKGKGKLVDEEEDLAVILERYQQELSVVCLIIAETDIRVDDPYLVRTRHRPLSTSTAFPLLGPARSSFLPLKQGQITCTSYSANTSTAPE